MNLILSDKTHKVLLYIIGVMVAVVWVILGYLYLDSQKVKARLEERQRMEKILMANKDSVNAILLTRLYIIIHKLDSVSYIQYLENNSLKKYPK